MTIHQSQWTPSSPTSWYQVHGKFIFKRKNCVDGTYFEIWEYEHLLCHTSSVRNFETTATRIVALTVEEMPAIAA